MGMGGFTLLVGDTSDTIEMKKRILYIQHAGDLGGSCMSLLYTMQGLDLSRFEPVVALIRPCKKIITFYEKAGFTVVAVPGIYTFEHTTASWARLSSPLECLSLMSSLLHWQQSMRLTLDLVTKIKPDLVHLNSVVLVPSAMALAKTGIPFVWHVREAPVKGYFGLRTNFMSSLLKKYSNEVIFISNSDWKNWVNKSRGCVIANFINLKKFYPGVSSGDIKVKLGISDNSKIILFMGGISKINGIQLLLKALGLVGDSIPNLVCILAGSNLSSSGSLASLVLRKILPLFGSGVLAQRVQKQSRKLRLESSLRFLSFQEDIRPYIAVSDIIVFPATLPHFARPVVEAAAMGKPSIGSDLGGINELIEHGRTGLLVEPGSPEALAEALIELLSKPERAEILGINALEKAHKEFDAEKQIAKITEIYDSILGREG